MPTAPLVVPSVLVPLKWPKTAQQLQGRGEELHLFTTFYTHASNSEAAAGLGH